HRVRLPDQPSRPGGRRLMGQAGALPAAGVRDCAEEPEHPDDALVPPQGRTGSLGVAVGPHDRERREEAGVQRVHAPAALSGYTQRWYDEFLRAVPRQRTQREADFLVRALAPPPSRVLDVCWGLGALMHSVLE